MNRNAILFYSRKADTLGPLRRALSRHFDVLLVTESQQVAASERRSVVAAFVDAGGRGASPTNLVEAIRARPDGTGIFIALLSDRNDVGEAHKPAMDQIDVELDSSQPAAVLLSAFWRASEHRRSAAWSSLEPEARAALGTAKRSFEILADLAEGRADPVAARRLFTETAASLTRVAGETRAVSILEQLRGHHDYTFAHSTKVALLLSGFGAAIGLGTGEQRLLAESGLLHDVGKLRIPIEILGKPCKLTAEEFAVMQGHAAIGGDILTEIYRDIPEVATIARSHHEKLDGSGYPDGLRGGRIPEIVLLTTVVDIFAALTDKRDYKDPLPAAEALAVMRPLAAAGQIEQRLFGKLESFLMDTQLGSVAA